MPKKNKKIRASVLDALLFFSAFFGKIFEIDHLGVVCNIETHIHVDVDDVHKRRIKSLRISSGSALSSLLPCL